MRIDAREIIAVIVTLGTFGLLGGFVFTGGHLDSGTGVALVAFTSGSLGSVLGFYFGKTNGAQTQLASSTTMLASQALQMASQRRTTDVLVPGVTQPAPPGANP
jgi:hypothetical protein